MSLARSLLLVVGVWALAYLPALGSLPLRGEEGRRVLPAVQMLESGSAASNFREVVRSYVVPRLGSRIYLRKPPLTNWLVAVSIKISGQRNGWTARLPSAVAVLAVGIAFVTVARSTLGGTGSVIAALCWLTSLGALTKGRMIEIDALYTALFAGALICWLVWSPNERFPWRTWIIPGCFLGLTLLAKGPVSVLCFYALIVAVLWRTRRLHQFVSMPHAVGVTLMLMIFAAWAIPLLLEVGAKEVLGTWSHEMGQPVAGREQLGSVHWLLNLPRGAALFLPAAFLLPFTRYSRISDPFTQHSARALWHAGIILFVVILLLPGAYPKYAMPLIPVMCWLIGIAVANNAFAWRDTAWPIPSRLVIASVAAFAVGAVVFMPVQAATTPKARHKVTQNADLINNLVPAGETLYVSNSDESFLFYVRAPVRHLARIEELPRDARYCLVRAIDDKELQSTPRWQAAAPRRLARTNAPEHHMLVLYAFGGLR